MQFINIKQLSDALVSRNQILQKLELLVNAKDYIRVEPDYFEPYERFIQMNKRIKKETMVKIINQDGSLAILRPDVTTNLIKQIIPKWSDQDSLKVYYIASTFSQLPMQTVLETKQFGVEYLGDADVSDQKVIELIVSIFKSFKMDFILEISNQSFLNALIEDLSISEDAQETLKSIIDYKNQEELLGFIKNNSLTDDQAKLLSNLFKLQGDLETIINDLKPFKLNQKMSDAIAHLIKLKNNLEKHDLLRLTTFDLSLISKFDYYDGVTFKGYLKGVSFPVLSGGRYDLLTKEFGKKVPATGFSLDLSEFIKEASK
ncbi:MAG: ATP phosphoribosyltransferase regulatory subunit [Acholeplasmataceae bacterium]